MRYRFYPTFTNLPKYFDILKKFFMSSGEAVTNKHIDLTGSVNRDRNIERFARRLDKDFSEYITHFSPEYEHYSFFLDGAHMLNIGLPIASLVVKFRDSLVIYLPFSEEWFWVCDGSVYINNLKVRHSIFKEETTLELYDFPESLQFVWLICGRVNSATITSALYKAYLDIEYFNLSEDSNLITRKPREPKEPKESECSGN